MIIVFLTSYMTSVRETGRDPGIAPLFGGLGLITLIIVGSLGVKYLNSRFEMSRLRKTGALDISATYQFDEDFVTVEDSKGNQSKVRWSEYQKVTKSGDYYFLKFNKKSFQWIPVRAFLSAEDREAFEKIVSARGLLGKK